MRTNPYSRHEVFLAALSDSGITVPAPLNREEAYLAKIAGEDVTIPDAPLNRYETYLAKLAGEDVTVPTPASRLETYLYKACGNAVETPVPVSREEVFWQRWIGYELTGSTLVIPDALAGAPRSAVVNIHFTQTFEEGQTEPSPDHPAPITGWQEAVIAVKNAENVTKATYTKDLTGAGTVYVGELDLLDNLLTITHDYKQFNSETWKRTGAATNKSRYFYYELGVTGLVVNKTETCSHLVYRALTSDETDPQPGCRVYNSTSMTRIAVRTGIDSIKETSDMKAWCQDQYDSGTPLQFVYQLTTPEEYQLGSTNFVLLEGYNKITCNCGTITIKYTPDL